MKIKIFFICIFFLEIFAFNIYAVNTNFLSLYEKEKAELDNFISFNLLEDDYAGCNCLLNEPTPSQPQGPFYPLIKPSETDIDLTKIKDGAVAIGTQVRIQGQVMYDNEFPIKNAYIEIWQACASGKYNHPQDPNTAEIDHNFQYYAEIYTNEQGNYSFLTIVPGPYPARANWWRPPHIHFKITAEGFEQTTTQLYFNGSSFTDPISIINGKEITSEVIDQLNKDDLILQRLEEKRRKKLIVSFQNGLLNNENVLYEIGRAHV